MSLPEQAHEGIRELYTYWREIAPERRLPGRQHFEPLDIPRLLPNIWLIDVYCDPLRFWRRLVGTRIEEFAGRSLTRGWVADQVDGPRLSSVHENLSKVVETARPSWRRGKSLIKSEKDFVDLERLFLPMATDGETVDMILAMTVFHSLPLSEQGDRDLVWPTSQRATLSPLPTGDQAAAVSSRTPVSGGADFSFQLTPLLGEFSDLLPFFE